jgi:hypothetical protein
VNVLSFGQERYVTSLIKSVLPSLNEVTRWPKDYHSSVVARPLRACDTAKGQLSVTSPPPVTRTSEGPSWPSLGRPCKLAWVGSSPADANTCISSYHDTCRLCLKLVIDGPLYMKTLFTNVAVASLSQSPVHAWPDTPMIRLGLIIERHAYTTQTLIPEPRLCIAFADPAAINATSVVIELDQALILINPVGPHQQYSRFGRPDSVVLTSADPDHLSIDAMTGLLRRDTLVLVLVLAPQSVIDQLPLMISNNVVSPFDIGTGQTARGITFRAVSRSSNSPLGSRVHDRDRGDIGVLIKIDGQRAFF